MGNPVQDLDIDDVAVNDGDSLVLSVTQRVIIHSGLIAIIDRVSCVHWIRIVIIDEVYGHAQRDVAPAEIIIPADQMYGCYSLMPLGFAVSGPRDCHGNALRDSTKANWPSPFWSDDC